MRAIVPSASAVILLIAAYFTIGGFALPDYQQKIPNGANVKRNGVSWPGVGHMSSGGGDARNPFGLAFAAAGHVWTTALCNGDADGDGVTNGMELGDPNCVWTAGATPSRTTDISHPGFNDSVPAAATTTTTTAAPTTTTAAPTTTTAAPTTTMKAPTTTTKAPTTTTTKVPTTTTTKAPTTTTTKAPTTTTNTPTTTAAPTTTKAATPAPPNNQNTPPATPATAPPATTSSPAATTTSAPTSPSTSDVPQYALYGTVAAAVLLLAFVRQ